MVVTSADADRRSALVSYPLIHDIHKNTRTLATASAASVTAFPGIRAHASEIIAPSCLIYHPCCQRLAITQTAAAGSTNQSSSCLGFVQLWPCRQSCIEPLATNDGFVCNPVVGSRPHHEQNTTCAHYVASLGVVGSSSRNRIKARISEARGEEMVENRRNCQRFSTCLNQALPQSAWPGRSNNWHLSDLRS